MKVTTAIVYCRATSVANDASAAHGTVGVAGHRRLDARVGAGNGSDDHRVSRCADLPALIRADAEKIGGDQHALVVDILLGWARGGRGDDRQQIAMSVSSTVARISGLSSSVA